MRGKAGERCPRDLVAAAERDREQPAAELFGDALRQCRLCVFEFVAATRDVAGVRDAVAVVHWHVRECGADRGRTFRGADAAMIARNAGIAGESVQHNAGLGLRVERLDELMPAPAERTLGRVI